MAQSRTSVYSGRFEHTLDDKNRLTIPSLWRWVHTDEETFLAIPHPDSYIAVLPPGPDGLPVTVAKLRGPEGKLDLRGPLDITMDPATGILYVADFGKQSTFGADGSMVLLRPIFQQ